MKLKCKLSIQNLGEKIKIWFPQARISSPSLQSPLFSTEFENNNKKKKSNAFLHYQVLKWESQVELWKHRNPKTDSYC